MRECWRVLKDDGVMWLNLGDSYSGAGYSNHENTGGAQREDGGKQKHILSSMTGLKPKDLIGIPWRVAFALQQPWYSGQIKNEADRIWLAAMIDTEGCLFIHKRKTGQNNGQGYSRKHDTFGAGMEVANTHYSIVERCQQITGIGSICYQDKESALKNRNLRLYRWSVRSNECRDIVREVYPYLVAKKHEARLLLGCPSSGENAERAHAGLIALHNGQEADIDFPEPASMYEPGWYLRQDIIWSKLNPMPESVTDRCTKSHEYIFLLTKRARYYYDAEAIKEPFESNVIERMNSATDSYGTGYGNSEVSSRMKRSVGTNSTTGRNRRSVWTVATQPYSGAHFATFPPALIEPMILAGSRRGDVVLDPFAGSGTTGAVAVKHGRRAVLLDLNTKYIDLQFERTNGVQITMPLETIAPNSPSNDVAR